MTIAFNNYTLKNLAAIEIMKVENLSEVADWLELNLPSGSSVNRAVLNYGTLLYTTPDGDYMLQVGNYLGVDANEKIFKINKETIDAFYDLVP